MYLSSPNFAQSSPLNSLQKLLITILHHTSSTQHFHTILINQCTKLNNKPSIEDLASNSFSFASCYGRQSSKKNCQKGDNHITMQKGIKSKTLKMFCILQNMPLRHNGCWWPIGGSIIIKLTMKRIIISKVGPHLTTTMQQHVSQNNNCNCQTKPYA